MCPLPILAVPSLGPILLLCGWGLRVGGMCPLSKLGALEGSYGSEASAQPYLVPGWLWEWVGRHHLLVLHSVSETVTQGSPVTSSYHHSLSELTWRPTNRRFAQLSRLVQGRCEYRDVKKAAGLAALAR